MMELKLQDRIVHLPQHFCSYNPNLSGEIPLQVGQAQTTTSIRVPISSYLQGCQQPSTCLPLVSHPDHLSVLCESHATSRLLPSPFRLTLFQPLGLLSMVRVVFFFTPEVSRSFSDSRSSEMKCHCPMSLSRNLCLT